MTKRGGTLSFEPVTFTVEFLTPFRHPRFCVVCLDHQSGTDLFYFFLFFSCSKFVLFNFFLTFNDFLF